MFHLFTLQSERDLRVSEPLERGRGFAGFGYPSIASPNMSEPCQVF